MKCNASRDFTDVLKDRITKQHYSTVALQRLRRGSGPLITLICCWTECINELKNYNKLFPCTNNYRSYLGVFTMNERIFAQHKTDRHRPIDWNEFKPFTSFRWFSKNNFLLYSREMRSLQNGHLEVRTNPLRIRECRLR